MNRIPLATKSIPVRNTGPVDDDNYPIFCPQCSNNETSTESTPNPISQSSHDLDYLDKLNNNDPILSRNDSLLSICSQEDDDPLHPSGLLIPGNISNSDLDALLFYGLVDSIRPYHTEHMLSIPEGMLWISGHTVATKTEADHPSIDRDDPHYNAHVPGHFRVGELVEYSLNECGIAAKQIEEKHHQTSRLVHSGKGTIWMSHSSMSWLNNQIPRSDKYRIRFNDAAGKETFVNLETKWYDIQRINAPTPSPLKKLFHVKVTPESVFMAWKLKDILIDLGIAHDWLTVNIIAEYMPLCYQRDIYFNVKLFEKVVHQQSECKNDADILKIAAALRSRRNGEYQQEVWPNDRGYYRNKISKISLGLSPQKHPLLSQDPYLPQITPSGRDHIGIITKRLDIALKPSTNLYGYQLHTVLWCHELERSILAKQSLAVGSNDLRFCPDATINCAVYFNPENGGYSSALKPQVIKPRIVTYGGGIISDDVGLGKTLTMLSLIAAHPFGNDISKHTLSGPNRNDLECGPNGDTIRCAATLVIAPSHLVHQWKQEIDRHFNTDVLNLKVLTITTQSEHQRVTYRNVLEAHVVLVSGSFLCGTYYQYDRISQPTVRNHHWQCIKPQTQQTQQTQSSSNSNTSNSPAPVAVVHQETRRRSARLRIKKNKNNVVIQDWSIRGPYLDLFHWRRLILDEGHELVRDDIDMLSGEFKWYCTATPFPTPKIMEYAARFLDIRINDNFAYLSGSHERSISVLHNVMYHHLYSRHTKESIAADNHLPDIQESCKFIDFHPIERVLYDATTMLEGTKLENRKLERAICSGAMGKMERGLFTSWQRRIMAGDDEVRLWLQDCDGYITLKKVLEVNQRNVEKVMTQLSRDTNRILNIKNTVIPTLQKYQKEVDEKKQEFKQQNQTWNPQTAWTNRWERENHSDLRIKMNRAKRQIRLWEEGMKIWPAIKDKLNENIDGKIKEFEENIAKSAQGDVLLGIMRKYGSKQAMLLMFVQQILEDPNSRIIIFSLFASLLGIVRDRLALIGIKASLCSGNVHCRKKAMRAFQREVVMEVDGELAESRIILLSSKAAASGADLKLATHIILVDPVPGSASESFAAERQAIGRAMRQGMDERGIATKVIRLVVRDTIEQETHERNEKVREQDRSNQNGDLAQLCGLKMEHRNRDEIDFFLRIHDHAKQSTESSNSNSGTEQNGSEFTGLGKRQRSDLSHQGTETSVDDDDDMVDPDALTEPPNKKRKWEN